MRLLLLVFVILLPITASADWKSDAEKAVEEGRTKDAVNVLKPLADEGNAEAAWLLGLAVEREILLWDEQEQIDGRDIILFQLHYWEVAAWQKHSQAALNLGLVYMGRYPHHQYGARVKRDLDTAKIYLKLASQYGNEQATELLAGWDDSNVWYCVGEAAPATPLGIEPVRNRLKVTVKFHTYGNRMDWNKQTYECHYNEGVKICKNGKKTFGFDLVKNKEDNLDFYYISGQAELLTVGNGTCEAF